ncbi:hypothetical protein BaRGS_00033332 [Batillaria attramentaria]|uniref:Uncharacterized protein n=1 Tax=Batillaria attramentaria TaxID=370345 RepID=A0ABD0JKR7_9CAEN
MFKEDATKFSPKRNLMEKHYTAAWQCDILRHSLAVRHSASQPGSATFCVTAWQCDILRHSLAVRHSASQPGSATFCVTAWQCDILRHNVQFSILTLSDETQSLLFLCRTCFGTIVTVRRKYSQRSCDLFLDIMTMTPMTSFSYQSRGLHSTA